MSTPAAPPTMTNDPEEGSRKGRRLSRAITGVLNGEFLTREEVIRHIPFLLYVCSFFVISIALGYSFDNTEREKARLSTKLKEMNAEYKTLKTELETNKQLSTVSRRIEALGLEEATAPPAIIEYRKEDLEKQR